MMLAIFPAGIGIGLIVGIGIGHAKGMADERWMQEMREKFWR